MYVCIRIAYKVTNHTSDSFGLNVNQLLTFNSTRVFLSNVTATPNNSPVGGRTEDVTPTVLLPCTLSGQTSNAWGTGMDPATWVRGLFSYPTIHSKIQHYRVLPIIIGSSSDFVCASNYMHIHVNLGVCKCTCNTHIYTHHIMACTKSE